MKSQNNHTDITVTLPELHAGQEDIVANAERFNILACGRRWGKTLFWLYLIAMVVKEGLEKASAGGFAANYQVSGLVGELSRGLTGQGERGFFSKIYSAFKSVFSSPDKTTIKQDQDRFANFADRIKNLQTLS